MQLDVPIMFVLPLMPSDINTEDVPRIHNLLGQVMNCFASRTVAGIAAKKSAPAIDMNRRLFRMFPLALFAQFCLICLVTAL